MSDQLDILVIDNKIRNNFITQLENINIYQERLLDIEETLKNSELSSKKVSNLNLTHSSLVKYIDDIKNEIEYNFYIIKTIDFIEEYKKILNQPIKISFLGKPCKINKEKEKIIESYMNIAHKYIKLETEKDPKNIIICKNCPNKKDFDILDSNIYICNNCYAQQIILKHNSSYNDIDRINISSKYMYDRKVHFRDCIKQYQGKQNSTIPNKIYRDLTTELNNHHLLLGNEGDDKLLRFKNVTKNHILLFLKDLGYSSHYENVHLIHHNLTGIKANDISHLEDKLLDDFDILTDLYDKKFKDINRKNFINTQYVLYQLLCRHKYPCKKEEFIVLKTIDRKFFHDEICKTLFEFLGWNATPYF